MWTIMWTENSQDRWDRLETKEEVMQLLDSLDKNSGVSKGDVWIFPPQADDLALTGNDIYEEDKESRLLYIYELIARRMCK